MIRIITEVKLPEHLDPPGKESAEPTVPVVLPGVSAGSFVEELENVRYVTNFVNL